MSAYTPKMGGADTTNTKTIIGYASQAPVVGIPAILRLTPAEHDSKSANSIKIQIHPTTGSSEQAAVCALQATVNAERAAYLQMIQPVSHVDVLSPADVRAEHELLSQIPRLKERLAALDSEMHANASSDVDKRLLVHERIMQLQGAQLTRVQQAVEHTVKSMNSLIDQHAQQDVQNESLRAKTALHEKIHKVSIESLVGMRKDTQALRKTSALHTELHKASGEGVLGLRDETQALRTTSDLHTELHQASGDGVLRLRDEALALRTTSDLHTQLHQAGGAGVLGLHAQASKLQETSDLHTQLHMASGKCMSTLQASGDPAFGDGGDEMRQLRADLDDLMDENKRLKASVALHDELHRATSAIVSTLHNKQTVDVHSTVGACTCGEHGGPRCRCKACHDPHARHTHAASASVDAESGKETHARILSMLQTDIASSNRPRQKRGI